MTTVRGGPPGQSPTWVWGVPLAPLTADEVMAEVDRRIETREPALFLSANLNFAMICERDPELRAVTRRAAFVLADGMPLVWASRLTSRPVPERLAGSDLIFMLGDHSARRGYSVFLLGGAPGVGEEAARELGERFPGIRIVGTESPPFRPASTAEDQDLVARIRDTGADILLMASSQPRGEKWLDGRLEALGIPVCFQMGAALDFAAGRVRRAPSWVQRVGMEWAFRVLLEPKRLASRYFDNGMFLLRVVARGALRPDPAPLEPKPSRDTASRIHF